MVAVFLQLFYFWWICAAIIVDVDSYRLINLGSRYLLSSDAKVQLPSLQATCLVTGCTGVLGQALLQRFQKKGYNVHGVHRKKGELKFDSFDSDSLRLHPIPLEALTSQQGLLNLLKEVHCPDERHLVLVNNAALYDRYWSKESLQLSFQTNFILPVTIVENLLELISNVSSVPFLTYDRVTIINVSSGDGEQLYLSSQVAHSLAECSTMCELRSLASSLISSFDDQSLLSFAPSPAYSLSKAFLNKATSLLQRAVDTTIVSEIPIRIVAVCPGNFLSPMTTSDELSPEQTDFMLTPDQAVEYFLPVIEDSHGKFRGGYFYRYGQLIPF